MNFKKMMTGLSVAVLFAQMGFADVSQEITAEEAQAIQEQMQELATTSEEEAALLLKKQGSTAAVETEAAAEQAQN